MADKTEIVARWYICENNGILSIEETSGSKLESPWLVSIYQEENDSFRFMRNGSQTLYGVQFNENFNSYSYNDIYELFSFNSLIQNILSKIEESGLIIGKNYEFYEVDLQLKS